MPTINLADRRIYYTRQGPSALANNVLVLVHGAGGTHLDWPVQLRHITDTTVYALDLPGHGRSDFPGRTSIKAYANDLSGFLEALGLEPVILLGHSMGGAIILRVALQHPSAVKGLVLLSTGARLRVTSAILDKVLSDYDGVVDFVTKFAWSQNASPEMVSLGRRMLHQARPEIVHGDYVACNNYDLTDRLNEIDVPTLIIGGADDKMTPIANSQYLADHIIGANLVSVNGGGHMLAQEQPEPVASAVLEFLASVDGSRD